MSSTNIIFLKLQMGLKRLAIYFKPFTSGVETGGGRGGTGPPLFCHAVSNENNMKNIEITNGFIFKKHVAFLTSRLPMILCP